MHRIVREFEIELTAEDVLKGQGIDPGRASERLFAEAEKVLGETHELLQPASTYMTLPITGFSHHRISFRGGFFEGSLVGRAMAGADDFCIVVCTIGESLEKKVEALMNENPVRAVALDGAGIAALRRVSIAVVDLISAEACELNLNLGMRAQPGQEGWPIEQQRQVFSLLPAGEIGVRLTESCLMIPRKSVSFVIPRGKDLDGGTSPCDFCSKRARCEWRRDKQESVK